MYSSIPQLQSYGDRFHVREYSKKSIDFLCGKVRYFETDDIFKLPCDAPNHFHVRIGHKDIIFDADGFTDLEANVFAHHISKSYKYNHVTDSTLFTGLVIGITWMFNPYDAIYAGLSVAVPLFFFGFCTDMLKVDSLKRVTKEPNTVLKVSPSSSQAK